MSVTVSARMASGLSVFIAMLLDLAAIGRRGLPAARSNSSRPQPVLCSPAGMPRECGIEGRSRAVPMGQPDDLPVEKVGLHIAGAAAQRLPGGVGSAWCPAGYVAWRRPVGARRGGRLERDELDSRPCAAHPRLHDAPRRPPPPCRPHRRPRRPRHFRDCSAVCCTSTETHRRACAPVSRLRSTLRQVGRESPHRLRWPPQPAIAPRETVLPPARTER